METKATQMHDSLAARAEWFAIRAHGDQKRKGSGVAYVSHPINVAHILRDLYPDDPNLEVAGFLHDVVEDTPIEIAEIERRFGHDVAYLVWGVTLRDGWALSGYANHPRVLRLKAADTLDNVRDTIIGLEKGHDVWSRFGAGRNKINTWTKHRNVIADHLPAGDPVVGLLTDAIERVASL